MYNQKLKKNIISAASLLLASSGVLGDMTPIQSGQDWLDTKGNLIEAHGGDVFQANGKFYWVGQDRTHNNNTFRALKCYSSDTLTDWTLENDSLTPAKNPELPAEVIIARPKVVYNELTKSYVMWFKYRHPTGIDPNMRAGVASSSEPCGDYKVETVFFPTVNNVSHYAGDTAMLVDDDGTGYYVISSIGELKDGKMGTLANGSRDRRMKVFKLTPDFRNVAELLYEFPLETNRKARREGPALAKIDGKYVMLTSGTQSWKPNQQKYSIASSMAGPWSEWKNIGPKSGFKSQTAYVIPVHGSEQTTYIYGADRHAGKKLIDSRYVWLPIDIKGDQLDMKWYDSWSIDTKTGLLQASAK